MPSDTFKKSVLTRYAESRGISIGTLEKYCNEVVFTIVSEPNVIRYAIGFPNDNNGWVLRSRKYKLCTSSHPTTICKDGVNPDGDIADTVCVFEGFIDFLSWAELGGSLDLSDACILNSVSNIRTAMPWILRHREVHLYLDKAGVQAREFITSESERTCRDYCVEIKVTDMSELYEGHKDLNEFLASRLQT